MKNLKIAIVPIIGILIAAAIGCQNFIDRITPTNIGRPAVEYSDVNTTPIASLYRAKEVRTRIITKHRQKQTDLARLAEDDKFAYTDALEIIVANIQSAENFQKIIIGSEDQPFSILGLLAGGAIAGPLAAAYVPRKKDKIKISELEAKLK